MPVIDASVYVALVNAQEPDHAASWAWYRRVIAERAPIIAPNIILAEIAAALSRGSGDAALANRAVQQLQQSNIIALAPILQPLAGLAADIASRYRIRGCDSLYVALAQQTGEALVTLDHQQLERGITAAPVYRPS